MIAIHNRRDIVYLLSLIFLALSTYKALYLFLKLPFTLAAIYIYICKNEYPENNKRTYQQVSNDRARRLMEMEDEWNMESGME